MSNLESELKKHVGNKNDKRQRITLAETNSDDVDYEVAFEKPTLRFKDIGGMQDLKEEVSLKIIHPLNNPEIYKSYGKKIGGGILLYGPPGCGKTMLARATAGEVNAHFFAVGINQILDLYLGESERNLHEIFEKARANRPSVLFFDEVDALAAKRSDMKKSAGRQIINQFLSELDGVQHSNEGLLILAATNTPWHLDSAFQRPGRFDRVIFVHPPDAIARQEIFRLELTGKPIAEIDYTKLAKQAEKFSGADIAAVVDIAVEEKIAIAIKTGKQTPLETKDLLNAMKKHRPTTIEWFATAKNYADFANNSGLYDDVINFHKEHKY